MIFRLQRGVLDRLSLHGVGVVGTWTKLRFYIHSIRYRISETKLLASEGRRLYVALQRVGVLVARNDDCSIKLMS